MPTAPWEEKEEGVREGVREGGDLSHFAATGSPFSGSFTRHPIPISFRPSWRKMCMCGAVWFGAEWREISNCIL